MAEDRVGASKVNSLVTVSDTVDMVTTTVASPPKPGGVVHVTLLDDVHVVAEHPVPPDRTAGAGVPVPKLDPNTVIVVPPVAGVLCGVIEEST